jgi:uncharacterized protein involved in outer membrane biogenesis
MKFWKSPVFYFGIFLVLAVAAALIAPHVITWDSYRADIEAYGRQLTGRPVSVRGPIDVTLFPWPDIKLRDVRVANPEAASTPDFMRAEEIEVSLTLAGFFSGQFRVESVNVRRPEFWVERMATAAGTWQFEPEIDLTGARISSHFQLDQIAIEGATVHLIESRRGGAATIEKVDATISGADVRGPWRIRGRGEYQGHALDMALNTGIWRAGEPFKFGLRLAPSDGSGLTYILDGANTGTKFEGTLRIEPAVAEGGKTDAEGTLRPLVFNSRVSADFDSIALNKIEIAPRGSDGANLLAGSAHVALGEEIKLKSDLSATRFDLDAIAGAQMRALVREGDGLEVLESFVDSLPKALEAEVKIKVVSLIAGGEPLANAYASFRAGGGTIRVEELSAEMPGQSEGLFSGVFAATDKGPQLAGDLAFEAFNLRDFVSWLAPEHKDAIAKAWTGSRGRFKFDGRLDAAGDSIRFSGAKFQIDDTLGSGTAVLSGGKRTIADFDLRTGSIDIDAFMPQGVRVVSSGGASGWSDVASLIAPIIPDSLNLKLTAEKLRLNGVDAQHVALDLASNPAGLAVNSLTATAFGEAELDASGQINFAVHAPAGSGTVTIHAPDPRGILRLAGLMPHQSDPFWSRSLGATDMKVGVVFTPKNSAPSVHLSASGRSGDLVIEANLNVLGSFDWRVAELSGSAGISSQSSSAIAGLAGLASAAGGGSPGHLTITLTGSLADKLLTDIRAEVFGARLGQRGTLKLTGRSLAAVGQLSIESERPAEFIKALGLVSSQDGKLQAEAAFTFKDGSLSLSAINGQWQAETVSGSLMISPDLVLSGNFDTSYVDLASALGAVFLPWDGKPADPETGFAEQWPLGLTGEIWVHPRKIRIFGDYLVTESQLGVVSNRDGRRLELSGFAPSGGRLALGAGVKQKGEVWALDANIDMPFDLAALVTAPDRLPAASGTGNVQLKLAGEGRSPAAALAAAQGGGSYALNDFKLTRIDTNGFLEALATAKTAENVRTALNTLVSGGAIDLGDVQGSVTVVGGMAALVPVKVSSADSDVEIRSVVEAATGSADIGVKLSMKGKEVLPTMEINYAGTPGALIRTVDASALESYLGMEVLQRAMRELEAVQREQQRLLEEEARQAKIDAERLAAWEAHRKELQARQRELKVHQRIREEDAKKYAQWLTDLTKLVKPEMTLRSRELRVQRRMRLEQERAQKAPAITDPAEAGGLEPLPPVPPSPATSSRSTPASPPRPKSEAQAAEPPAAPLVLVPPSEPLVLVPPTEPKRKSIFDFFTQRRKKSFDGSRSQ